MNLHKLIFTENDCYKRGRKITPKGIMVHSTGANNPMLHRYVGPDDGLLGPNQYGNDWNRPGTGACPHAFIGKLQDGSIATYQVLPWDHRAWHCGGNANSTHISFEICEDGLHDPVYFNAVYTEAVELCAHLCREFDLSPDSIICHSEGHEMGIASNHGDVMHWFPKHSKSMDTFRADVGRLLHGENTYIVQDGDTLWGISKRYLGRGDRWEEIQKASGLRGTLIDTGDCLTIPGVTIHHVEEGEYLSLLAKNYYGDASRWPEIQKANGISGTVIHPNDQLLIP